MRSKKYLTQSVMATREATENKSVEVMSKVCNLVYSKNKIWTPIPECQSALSPEIDKANKAGLNIYHESYFGADILD